MGGLFTSMADDPVRLLVKNTFLQLDEESTEKSPTIRRRSDGDVPNLSSIVGGHVVPPGEFFRGGIEAGEDDYVPQPDSPMRVPPRRSKRGSRSSMGSTEDDAARPRDSMTSLSSQLVFSDYFQSEIPMCNISTGLSEEASDIGQSSRPRNSTVSDPGLWVLENARRLSQRYASADDDDRFYDYVSMGAGMPPPMPPAMQQAALGPGFGHDMPNPMLATPVTPWGYPNDMGGWAPYGMPPTMPPSMPPGFNYNHGVPYPMQVPGSWEYPASGGRGRSNRQSGSSGGKGNTKGSSGGGGGGSRGSAAPAPEKKAPRPSELTTVMLRNLPDIYSRHGLELLLDSRGFQGEYDFIYMPMNFRTKASFGYAFANFVSNSSAKRCNEVFQDFCEWDVPSDKVCDVSWSNMHQGFFAHIDRYRNSPVMHESVPDLYKPAIFSGGERVRFPEPTKKVRVPRIRRAGAEGDAHGDNGADD